MSESPRECPLCLQGFDARDKKFQPCSCIYKVCRYCWYKIYLSPSPNCPGCRKPYNETRAFQQLNHSYITLFHKLRKLPRYGQESFQFLQMLAYFQPSLPIPIEIFHYSPSALNTSQACIILIKLGLLTKLAPNTITIGKRLQETVRRCCDQLQILSNVLEMYEVFLQLNETEDPKEELMQKVLPHAAACWSYTLENQHEELIKSRKNLFHTVIDKLDDIGMYPLCLKLVKMAIQPVLSIFGPNNIQTLRLKSDLGTALWRLGFNFEALDLLNELLPAMKIELGPTHWLTYGTLNELAYLLNRLGRWEEAVETINEVLAGMTPNHPDYCIVMRNKSILLARSAAAALDIV